MSDNAFGISCKVFYFFVMIILYCALLSVDISKSQRLDNHKNSYVTVTSQSFNTQYGTIAIKDVRVTTDRTEVGNSLAQSPKKLEAVVENNTSKSFESIEFTLNIANQFGTTIKSGTFSSDYVSSQSSRRLTQQLTNDFHGEVSYSKSMSFEIKLNELHYVAEYEFGLDQSNNGRLEAHYDFLSVAFRPSKEHIYLSVDNKTDVPITVMWNEAYYTGIDSSSEPIVYEEIKRQRDRDKIPSTILPPQTSTSTSVMPSSNVYYLSMTDEWREEPILPSGRQAEDLIGESISLHIPVDVGGHRKNLDFVFSIEEVSFR